MKVEKLVIASAIVLAMSVSPRAQEKPIEALDGTDPVLLVQGKDVLGKTEFKAVYGRFEYMFASAATKAEFEKNPAKYAIQLGGLCARMGRTASGNPSDYVVHEGKIYIFGSDACHKAFAAAPAKYFPPPVEPMPSSTTARAKGRTLLDRAATVIGGKKLDSLTAYVESITQRLQRMDAEVPVTVRTMWRFPDAFRAERSMQMGERTMASATLSTRAGAWFLAQGRSYPMIPPARENVVAEQKRQIVPLLRARHEEGFVAAALGPGAIAGEEVERVRIRQGALDVVLGLDRASGRPRSLSFTDRNDEGEFGLYTILYEDYRTSEGLTVPFSVRASFNGKADASQSRTVERVQVNGTLDSQLFEPPAGR